MTTPSLVWTYLLCRTYSRKIELPKHNFCRLGPSIWRKLPHQKEEWQAFCWLNSSALVQIGMT